MTPVRSKRLVLVIVLSLVAISIIGSLTIGSRFAEQSVILPDGSSFTLKAITFGTYHLRPSDRWKDRLYRMLPKPFQTKFGARLQPPRFAHTATNSFGIWIEHSRAKNSYGLVRLWVRVLEDGGDCSARTISRSWFTAQNKLFFIPVAISSTRKTVTLGVFDMPDWEEFKELATFKIRNPKRKP
jgi:hypothetical protein